MMLKTKPNIAPRPATTKQKETAKNEGQSQFHLMSNTDTESKSEKMKDRKKQKTYKAKLQECEQVHVKTKRVWRHAP